MLQLCGFIQDYLSNLHTILKTLNHPGHILGNKTHIVPGCGETQRSNYSDIFLPSLSCTVCISAERVGSPFALGWSIRASFTAAVVHRRKCMTCIQQ